MNKTQEMTIFITDDHNYTVATYTLEYEMSYLEDNETVDHLFSLLTGLFTELLKNKSINQWAVADEFLDNYADHLNNVEKPKILKEVANPCTSEEPICSICHKCTSKENKGLLCEAKCVALVAGLIAVAVMLCRQKHEHDPLSLYG
ncbi:hypothetical protein LSH36_4g06032 [Paralvinella palmiformis]|uniref:Uncharacterized protein n=1 Tax=Paralvinella palmiformis TaxID=53620 RepID=A0AAD9NJ20_9ANNE|nr:hypothetical protein LSH36_4g06032 [Paralvinella palmiformis]